MPDYDVITIGAGHNALISSAYLAQAGYRVALFERRDLVGGAVSTREWVPGYRFDLGGSAHILIRLTPVVEELGLHGYGLEYLDLDPLFFAPYQDGSSVFIYRDEQRTATELEAAFPGEGEAYLRFLDDWRPFARVVKDLFMSVPSPFNLGRRMMFGRAIEGDWRRALPIISQPYGDVVDSYFKEEKLKAPLVWMAAQSGPPPTEPFTAPFLLWHPLYHEGGVARPRGGSGELSNALARHIRAHGGSIFTGAPVDRILVEGPRATGVEVGGQTYTARAVIAGTHAVETFQRLLPQEHRPQGSDRMRVGNGFGAILRLALKEPVRYLAHPGAEARTALQLVCRDRQQILAAYGDYLQGRPAADPPLVAMTFSAVDDTLAPAGGEVLWLWAQYFPYQLSGGRHWDEIEVEVAESILDAFEVHAPGTRDKVVGRLFQHPLWLERELGLFRGNVMHLEMSLDQMFALRPFLGMAGYRSHLKGLYLTGASTHPGGGDHGRFGPQCGAGGPRRSRAPTAVATRCLAVTYLQFHLVFTLPLVLLLVPWTGWTARRAGGPFDRSLRFALAALAVHVVIAVVYTSPWDNYLVFRQVWGYPDGRVLFTIGYVPFEEYLFFILQTLLSGLFLFALARLRWRTASLSDRAALLDQGWPRVRFPDGGGAGAGAVQQRPGDLSGTDPGLGWPGACAAMGVRRRPHREALEMVFGGHGSTDAVPVGWPIGWPWPWRSGGSIRP